MKNRKTIYHSCLTTQAVEAVYTNIVHAYHGVLLGVCMGCAMIDSLSLTVLSQCIGMCMHSAVDVAGFSASWMRLCIAQLYVAGSHRYSLITFDAKLKGMFDWFAGGWSASNTSRYWKSIPSSIPSQSTSPWVYIFIIKQFELGSQTQDQSDHLALAFFLCEKSSVLNSNSNGNIFGLLYSSYLYFEWVKIASVCQCFCGLFSFRARLKIAPVTWVFPASYYAGSGATIWQIRSTHLDAECSGHFQSTPRIY